jgi:hypothetical protein
MILAMAAAALLLWGGNFKLSLNENWCSGACGVFVRYSTTK